MWGLHILHPETEEVEVVEIGIAASQVKSMLNDLRAEVKRVKAGVPSLNS